MAQQGPSRVLADPSARMTQVPESMVWVPLLTPSSYRILEPSGDHASALAACDVVICCSTSLSTDTTKMSDPALSDRLKSSRSPFGDHPAIHASSLLAASTRGG